MIAYYTEIKWLHVAFVIASLSLFAFRGTFSVLLDRPWGDHGVLRYSSYLVDTGLLTFALMLATMLHLGPISQPWFGTKLALLVLYILLGSLALRRARSRPARVSCFFAALLVAAWMFGVARAHHPAGWWALLG